VTRAYRVLARLIAAAVAVQAAAIAVAYFGLGAWVRGGGVLDAPTLRNHTAEFPGVAGFAVHGLVGELAVPAITVALLAVAVFAGVPGGVGWAAGLVVMVAAQVLLGLLAADLPMLGVLHGLLAVALTVGAVAAARRAADPQPSTRPVAGVPR
jgi:hypothetical protein